MEGSCPVQHIDIFRLIEKIYVLMFGMPLMLRIIFALTRVSMSK